MNWGWSDCLNFYSITVLVITEVVGQRGWHVDLPRESGASQPLVLGSGLQQTHGLLGVFCQAIGKDATCWPCPNDHIAIGWGFLIGCRWGWSVPVRSWGSETSAIEQERLKRSPVRLAISFEKERQESTCRPSWIFSRFLSQVSGLLLGPSWPKTTFWGTLPLWTVHYNDDYLAEDTKWM